MENCVSCSQKIAQSHVELLNDLKHVILPAAQKYQIDEYLIAAIISKVSNAGQNLNETGYQPCLDGSQCFGLMRVPTDRLNLTEMEEFGPRSVESIEKGIEWLLEISNCLCESTRLSRRKTNHDIVQISTYINV